MSDGDGSDELADRRLAVAAVSITLFCVVLALWLGLAWGALNLQQRERAYPIAETECANERECAQKALKVQAREAAVAEASVEIAVFQFALSAAGIFLIGLTAFYAHRAWLEARTSAREAVRANKHSAEAFEADHRAWVTIAAHSVSRVTMENGAPRVSMTLKVENIGPQPAFGVTLHMGGFRARGGGVGGKAIDEVIATGTKMAEITPMGTILLHGQVDLPTWTAVYEADPATDARLEIIVGGTRIPPRPLMLTAVYCVHYKSPTSPRLRHSSGGAWIRMIDGSDFPENGEVPLDKLRVIAVPTMTQMT